LQPDAVICATGYRRGLEPFVGNLGVLDERGAPRANAAHNDVLLEVLVGAGGEPSLELVLRGVAIGRLSGVGCRSERNRNASWPCDRRGGRRARHANRVDARV